MNNTPFRALSVVCREVFELDGAPGPKRKGRRPMVDEIRGQRIRNRRRIPYVQLQFSLRLHERVPLNCSGYFFGDF